MDADAIAAAIEGAYSTDVKLVRNGSRGLLWLEPLVEVQTPTGRIAYGPVTLDDLPSLMAADSCRAGRTRCAWAPSKSSRLSSGRSA